MLNAFSKLSLTEQALTVSVGASGMLLIGAHLFERVGGFPPCILCLDQREAHWTALGAAVAGLLIARVLKAKLGAAAAVGAVALIYAVSAGLAFYHTGVEYAFWPGPAICSGGVAESINLDAIGSALTQKAEAVSCADAPWRMFGVSMAGYNLLASAGLFALTLFAAISENRRARISRVSGGVQNQNS